MLDREQSEIGDFEEADVFIVGYPKSGNTWFQNLVSGLMYGIDPSITPDTLIQELVPDVHQQKYYSRYQTPSFFKSHFLPRPEYQRVIYLLRDGRDAMVSYFHHIKAVEHIDELDLIDVVRNGTYLFPCKWHHHVEQWLTNPYKADLIIVKYEEMLERPFETLRRVCTHIGVERNDSFLAQVVEKASFSNMQAQEIASGRANPAWPRDKMFVRRGVSGSFKDEMPPDVLHEFMAQAGDTLRNVGYLDA